jgi:tetratricopeptide (TPR) repeat protein
VGKDLRGVFLVCLFTVVCLLSYLTIHQIKIWHNPEAFWTYIIDAFPNTFPDAHEGLGQYYAEKGTLDKAISEFKQAIALKPIFARPHYNLGCVYAKKGMLDDAASEYKQALFIDPRTENAHTGLGLVYAGKKMFDEAISEWEKSIAIKPDDAVAHSNLAAIYYFKGNYKLAILHCDKATELGYRNPKLLELLKPHR